jgi:hypothetical protein
MNVTKGPFDAAVLTTRIRLLPLNHLLDKANKPDELRRWILERAGHDLCRVYFPLPWMTFAFPWPEAVAPNPLGLQPETGFDGWKERTEIKFVRLAPEVVGQFQYRGRMDVRLFPDGLFVPNDLPVNSELLEATTFSTGLRVMNALYLWPVGQTNQPDSDLRDCVTIMSNDLFVEDRVRNDVRDHFDDSPRTERTPYERATGIEEAPKSNATNSAIDEAKSSHTATDVANKAPETSVVEDPDPYGLKGRSDAVYALYQTAEWCARNPEFASAAKAQERLGIALKTFSEIMDGRASAGREENNRQEKLRHFLSKTRLNSALRLIDPHYVYNNGRTLKQQGEWPPAAGQTFLAQQDIRRQTFVTDMLRLMIGGVERWHDLDLSDFPKGTKRQAVLQRWLEKHGVAGTGVLKTAFEVITWNGGGVPALPKYDKLSTSHDQTVEGHPASRLPA